MKRGRCFFKGEKSDGETGHNPADGAEDTYPRKLFSRVIHLPKRDAVAQCDSRHIQKRINENDPVKRGGVGNPRGGQQQNATQYMQHAHDPLRSKEPIGHQPHEKRRNHGGNRQCTISRPNVCSAGVQVLGHIGAHGYIPGSPDEILEQHHEDELDKCDRCHDIDVFI